MDGYVTIGTNLDTKSFDAQISKLEDDLERLTEEYEVASKSGKFDEEELKKYRSEIEKTKNQIISLRKRQQDLNKTDLSNISKSINNIGSSVQGVIGKITRWGLALFGIRSAYNFIRQSASLLTQQNEQLNTDLQYIKYAIASTLEPVIKRIVELAYQLLVYIGTIVKRITGKNIFANANKGLKSAVGSAKELKKQLASFDEMNVLNDSSASGVSNVAPSIDLTNLEEAGKDLNAFKWIKEKWQEIIKFIEETDWKKVGNNLYKGLKKVFTSKGMQNLAKNIFKGLGTGLAGLSNFLIGLFKGSWDDTVKYFETWIQKSKELGGNIVDGILAGIVNALFQIGVWIYNNMLKPFINGFKNAFKIHSPSKVMEEMGSYLVEGLKNGIINIWSSLKSIFENLKNNIVNTFSQAWQGIKNIFSISNITTFFSTVINKITSLFRNIGTSVGNVIGSAFKNVINNVIRAVENILNFPIRSINSLIKTINKVPGINLGTLNTFSLPRLAKGGIINMPGRGVPVGSAIGGERGAEGVIPLTDSQQMALLGEAIGKYISINATVPVYVGNRLVAREMKRIEAEDNFAYNR